MAKNYSCPVGQQRFLARTVMHVCYFSILPFFLFSNFSDLLS